MSLGGALVLLALAGQVDPVPAGAGPRATSGEVSSDSVGYAAAMAPLPEGPFASAMIAVRHPTLPAGSFVEVTALDTGRTIVAQVLGGSAEGAVVALSPGAARQLGVGDRAALRVREVTPNAQDRAILLAGKSVAPRLDAPPALLAALRRRLPGRNSVARGTTVPVTVPSATPPSAKPAATSHAIRRTPPPPQRATGTLMLQVVALSSARRATVLAQKLGGRVLPGGGLYRVQLGPYADAASAKRARDGIARAGYGDARILHSN
ncbi:SPOR domain-containing protein [Sphingomonas sp. PAMC 26621]|uniref:SPOR domain-containing protein n=1 Tax=Sphingomonas sp. PAMC 26621 TaxID=1112213 RepID=UPI000301EE0C|nr:SPOR domain-containing protein [Sphingomonas sp. PAMC 26621]